MTTLSCKRRTLNKLRRLQDKIVLQTLRSPYCNRQNGSQTHHTDNQTPEFRMRGRRRNTTTQHRQSTHRTSLPDIFNADHSFFIILSSLIFSSKVRCAGKKDSRYYCCFFFQKLPLQIRFSRRNLFCFSNRHLQTTSDIIYANLCVPKTKNGASW